MSVFKYIIAFIFFLNSFQSKSQVAISEIDFDKIPQKKVREYLIFQQNSIDLLSEIEPSLKTYSSTEDYKKYTKDYFVKGSLQQVWNHYIYTNPVEAWDGKKVTVGLLYSNKDDKLVYTGERVAHLDTGQVVYLNLKFIKGVLNFATVIEFITIDQQNHIVEYSYIKGNKTEGKQRMEFFEDSKGRTCILHSSYFKSDSAIRDRFFYPFFHNKFSNEFHRNMRKRFIKKLQIAESNNQTKTNPISTL